MGIETVEYNNIKYAEIIWAKTSVDETQFFSPAESSFQFGLLAHKAGFEEPPHYHKAVKREINDLQQMFVVQRGVVSVELYNDDGKLDEKLVYRDNRINRIEIDRNLDGAVDTIQKYDHKGRIYKTEADDNVDGIFESTVTYKRSNPVLQESDTNQDGVIDYKA